MELSKFRKARKSNGVSKTYLQFKAGTYGHKIVTSGRAAGYDMEAITEQLLKDSNLEKLIK